MGSEVGVVDVAGVENAVGGDVKDVVVGEIGFEGLEGEVCVEVAIAGEDARSVFGGADDRVGFLFDVKQGTGALKLGGSDCQNARGGGTGC